MARGAGVAAGGGAGGGVARAGARHAPAPRAAVVEVPLLFEAGLDSCMTRRSRSISEESLRRRRAAERGHALVDERAARQLSQEEKARRATFVVRNDGSVRGAGARAVGGSWQAWRMSRRVFGTVAAIVVTALFVGVVGVDAAPGGDAT